jgi:hypothetical protein
MPSATLQMPSATLQMSSATLRMPSATLPSNFEYQQIKKIIS